MRRFANIAIILLARFGRPGLQAWMSDRS